MKAILAILACGIFVMMGGNYGLCADDDSAKVTNIVVAGNSLTRHGPSTELLGWKGNWGMAAMALENDYAHQLYKRIVAMLGYEPKLNIFSLCAKNFPNQPAFKATGEPEMADLVVLQCGDNLPADKSNEETFEKPYEALVNSYKEKGCKLIVCTSVWGGCPVRNGMIKKVCERTGAIYVYLGDLQADPTNSAGAEGHFTHKGVNWHPGDKGMAAIGEKIFEAIKDKLKK